MPLPVFNIKSFKIALKLKIKNLKLAKGFTLIELLVVISIIAILMAVATISYLNAQQKGRDNKRKTDLKAVQQALEIYFTQNAKYPSVNAGNGIMCNITSPVDNTTHAWNTQFVCNSVTYMNPLPKDPVTSTSTQYYYYPEATAAPQTYKLFAKLENLNDKDWINSPAGCATGATTPGVAWGNSGAYYCVINP